MSSQTEDDLELENRRRAERVNHCLEMVFRNQANAVYAGVALNLSGTGVRLVLERTGSSQENVISLWIDRDTQLVARSVWAQDLPGGRRRVVGYRFDPMGSKEKVSLELLLHNMKSWAA